MLAFNLVLTLVCFWLMLMLNSYFIQQAKWNAFRFRLFSVRDNLAMLAMKGKVDEHSQEYKSAMLMVTSTIKITRRLEVVAFLKFLYSLRKNEEKRSKVDSMAKDLCNLNEDCQEVIAEYFDVVHDIFHVQTRGFKRVAPILIATFGLVRFVKVFSNIVQALNEKLEKVNNLQDWLIHDRDLAKCKV